jgi:hypothetical protein
MVVHCPYNINYYWNIVNFLKFGSGSSSDYLGFVTFFHWWKSDDKYNCSDYIKLLGCIHQSEILGQVSLVCLLEAGDWHKTNLKYLSPLM